MIAKSKLSARRIFYSSDGDIDENGKAMPGFDSAATDGHYYDLNIDQNPHQDNSQSRAGKVPLVGISSTLPDKSLRSKLGNPRKGFPEITGGATLRIASIPRFSVSRWSKFPKGHEDYELLRTKDIGSPSGPSLQPTTLRHARRHVAGPWQKRRGADFANRILRLDSSDSESDSGRPKQVVSNTLSRSWEDSAGSDQGAHAVSEGSLSGGSAGSRRSPSSQMPPRTEFSHRRRAHIQFSQRARSVPLDTRAGPSSPGERCGMPHLASVRHSLRLPAAKRRALMDSDGSPADSPRQEATPMGAARPVAFTESQLSLASAHAGLESPAGRRQPADGSLFGVGGAGHLLVAPRPDGFDGADPLSAPSSGNNDMSPSAAPVPGSDSQGCAESEHITSSDFLGPEVYCKSSLQLIAAYPPHLMPREAAVPRSCPK